MAYPRSIRPDYVTGTIALTSGSRDFTTTGSSLEGANVFAGDLIISPSGLVLVIDEVTGQNSGTLMMPCPPDAAGAAVQLRIRFQPDGSRFQAAYRELAMAQTGGNLAALAGLNGSLDRVPVFDGPGSMKLVDFNAMTSGAAQWDALVATPAGLTAHDGAAAGFKVMVLDSGNGRAAVYEKQSATAGDWSAPIYFTGTEGQSGPANTLTIGSVVESAQPEVTITGSSPNQTLHFGLVKGEKGDTGDVTPETLSAKDAAEAARNAAQSSANSASASASSASGSASTATTQAANAASSALAAELSKVDSESASASASNSAASASNSASAASASQVASSGSASDAAASAGAASASATAATNKASEATSSASAAASSATSASASATTATDKATEASSARDFSYQWSSAAEGAQVDDGVRTGYSAYHWSKVAETAAGGGVQSVNGKTGASITLTAADVGAATAAQGAKADTALQTLTAGTNVSITGTGTSRTISATASPQVNSDWNATSGAAQILNKPTLGTAAYQNSTAFATATQGAKADSAVQTVNGVAPTAGNVTVRAGDTYDTVAAVASATIIASVNAIRTNGYGSAGDGGAATYKRVASEPAHAGKVQSSDGAWWEICDTLLTPLMFGGAGDNDPASASKNTAAFTALFDMITGGFSNGFHIPAGRYHCGDLPVISGNAVSITGDGAGISVLVKSSGTSTALSLSQGDFNDAVYMKGFSVLTTMSSASEGIRVYFPGSDASNNRLPSRVMVSDIEVRGADLATSGFANGVTFVNCHNGKFSNIHISGKQTASGRIGLTHMDAGLSIIGDGGVPTDLLFTNICIYAAKRGVDVSALNGGSVEGVHFLNSNAVACDYGYHCVNNINKPLFSLKGSHVAAFICGVKLTNMSQSFIEGNLIYKREDGSSATTSIELDTCNDSIICGNNMRNPTGSDLAGSFYGVSISNSNNVLTANNKVDGANIGYKIWGTSGSCQTNDNQFTTPIGASPKIYSCEASGANNRRRATPSLYVGRNNATGGSVSGGAAVTLIEFSTDNVEVGDEFDLFASGKFDKDTTTGIVTLLVVKSAGTANVVFNDSASDLRSTLYLGGSVGGTVGLSGLLRVTQRGSLQLAVQAYCPLGAASYSPGDIQSSVRRL